MTTHDKFGVEYAKMVDMVAGARVVTRDIECLRTGSHTVFSDDRGSYLDCHNGKHYLSGQDDGEGHLVGVYPFTSGPIDVDKVKEGLVKIKGMLVSGQLKHSKEGGKFNMDRWTGDCKTPVCIGGWLERFGYLPFHIDGGWPLGMDALFYPIGLPIGYEEVTVPEAIAAIDNYLEFDDPKWQHVVEAVS